MTTNDDDDDFVVPAGTRRSSFVPPTDESGDSIDIPRVVISGDIPAAHASGGEIPGMQRDPEDMIVTGEIPVIVVPDTVSSTDQAAVITPEASASTAVDSDIESHDLEPDETVVESSVLEMTVTPARHSDGELIAPVRQSLTPSELASALEPTAGLSSTEQMALLDSQIALRAQDADAASRFLDVARELGTEDAVAIFDQVKQEFADVAPEIVGVTITPARVMVRETTTSETSDDVVVEADEDAPVELSIDDAIAASDEETAAPQSWRLPAPASTVSGDEPRVRRDIFTSALGLVSIALATLVLGFSAELDPASLLATSVGSVAVWAVVVAVARRVSSLTGMTYRALIESVLGRWAGRILSGVIGLGVIVAAVIAVSTFVDGVAANESTGPVLTGLLDNVGPVVPIVTAALMLAGAIVAILPLRAFRAVALIVIGFTVLGTGTVVAMSGFLIASNEAWVLPPIDGFIGAIGAVSALAIAVGFGASASLQSLSREHTGVRNIVWLSIGLGLGFVVATGAIVAALMASEATHYFFANNLLLHVISSSTMLAVGIGGVASAGAVLLVIVLVIRGALSLTVIDDRDEPSVWWKLGAIIVVAGLTIGSMFVTFLPSLTIAATPIAIGMGLMFARTLMSKFRLSPVRAALLSALVVILAVFSLGYTTSSEPLWGWTGFINEMLIPYGFGLLYADALVPVAVAVITVILGTVMMIGRTVPTLSPTTTD